jgi:hypothetical protein
MNKVFLIVFLFASVFAFYAQDEEISVTGGILYNDGQSDYASVDARFILEAPDEGAGVKNIWNAVDDSDYGIYIAPLAFDSEGSHKITYKVEDNVGNISDEKTYEFILDKTPPELQFTQDKEEVKKGHTLYVPGSANFEISAQDALSGVKTVEYTMDEGDYEAYESAVSSDMEKGMHKLSYKATDNVGNVTETKVFSFYVDLDAPAVEFAVSPAPFEKDEQKFISDRSLIAIKAADDDSGVASILYAIDEEDFAEYSEPIALTEGTHTVKAKAIDFVGNESEEISIDLIVVVKAPEPVLNATERTQQ